VRVLDQAVVAFGKHLDEPAIDCGAFLLPPEVFDRQRQAASEGDHTLAGAVTRLAQTRPLRAVELPADCWWQDVDTPQDVRAAKVVLRRSLAKDADGPVSRWLNRPLSTRLSMVLAPLRPPPDLVSLVAFGLGLAGAVLLAAGQGLAGGLLVHASSVADGIDGEVARLQLRGGPRGALLDGLLDRVGDGAILGGLGLWALHGRGPEGVLVLTVAATTGALLSMASKDRAAALGPTTGARAGAGVAAGRPGWAAAAGRGGCGPGRTGRGPGRSDGDLGAVAQPTGRLPPPPAGHLKAGPAVRHLFFGSPPQALSSHCLLGVFTSSGGPGGHGRSSPERRSVGRAPCVLQPVDQHL
jgi:phosphatidylglycerophosphate synthase